MLFRQIKLNACYFLFCFELSILIRGLKLLNFITMMLNENSPIKLLFGLIVMMQMKQIDAQFYLIK